MAKTHLEGAQQIIAIDSVLAYTGVYDAARKAISAHMRARGYRATSGPEHHAKVIEYGREALAHLGIEDELDEFDRMRRRRNASEYGVAHVGREQVRSDLAIARAIVDAIDSDLRRPN